MTLTGEQFTISAGQHHATIVEVGAGLRRYSYRGFDITVSYPDDMLPPRGCGAVLVPWPNRLRGGCYSFDENVYQLPISEPEHRNAIHGLARWARWTPLRYEATSVTLAHDIVPQPGWPFEVRVEVTYSLDADRGLTVMAQARNVGVHRAPFGAGFHPYLATHGAELADVSLLVPARTRLTVDGAQVPVGTEPVEGTSYDLRRRRRLGSLRLDDTYTDLYFQNGRSSVQLHTDQGGARVWFDEQFRYVQVYTYEYLVKEQPGVAVEPMTCPGDAFNSGTGLVILEPGHSWSGRWGIAPV